MAADLLTTDEAAAVLDVSPRTLESWRVVRNDSGLPKGPEFIRIEGQVRYPRESLADYLTASFNKPALPRSVTKRLATQLRDPQPEPTQPNPAFSGWATIGVQA